MSVLLRSRRRLRCLLALALLAWGMLAIMPLGAMPSVATDTQTSTASTGTPHGSMHREGAGCCDDHAPQPHGHTPQPCPCALPCAGVLPAMPARLSALPPMVTAYAPPRPIQAPLSGFAPPLRPPLA